MIQAGIVIMKVGDKNQSPLMMVGLILILCKLAVENNKAF